MLSSLHKDELRSISPLLIFEVGICSVGVLAVERLQLTEEGAPT